MSPTIPKTQTAAIVKTSGSPIQIKHDHPVKSQAQLTPGECLVKLDCTGVCHTDLHAALGDWPVPPRSPLIGGHEGVGIIVAIGDHTSGSPVKVGDRVGIKWLADSCLNCEQCRKGLEQNCSKAKLSGYTVDGTFSEYVVRIKGVTVYRALKYSQTTAGDWVVLPGAGGGLGHLGTCIFPIYASLSLTALISRSIREGHGSQSYCDWYAPVAYSRPPDSNLYVDSGAEKKKLCEDLGADVWIDFKESKNIVEDVKKATGGAGAHSAVVTTASSSGYTQAIDYLRCGGTLMAVGLPGKANLEASIFFTVFKSIKILGSYVGNRQDAIEAVEIAARGAVKCHYQLRKIGDLQTTYEDMTKGMISGRVVLEFN
ncbi:hypothetical protein C0992_004557 [Termitomyces sp. T32_za158]|nr:hypothetical protein C0992_004557 [Termitomyces sp. T32_za158]